MTVTAADQVMLPYDSQFSYAGVQYACKSLSLAYSRMIIEDPDTLRGLVTGVALEMAARRWLEEQPVRYNRLSAAAFTDPRRFDLAIGGRRCNLKSILIANKREITRLHAHPGELLKIQVAIPIEELETDQMNEQDIYLFGFVTGLSARHPADTEKALASEQPVYLMRGLPAGTWGGASPWQSLGGLVLKSNARETMHIEVSGLGANREPLLDKLELPPRVRTSVNADYFAVQYLRVDRPPDGEVGLHSPALGLTELIAPTDWWNIWVYGMRVYLCGWISKHDFRAESQRPDATFPPAVARNRVLPISALQPMSTLATLAKRFGA
jgi:hypothetical protein